MKMASRYVFCIVMMLFVVTGCASTKLVSSWTQEGFSGAALKKVLVLAVVKEDLQRRLYEDSFVEKLQAEGVDAVASYTLVANLDGGKEQNKQRIQQAVKSSAADSVLIATLVGVEKNEQYVAAPPVYIPQRGGAYGMYGYYGRSYEMIYHPGYTIENTTVKLNTTVFRTETEEMLWAGDTRSYNPTSVRTVIEDNINVISAAMKKDGLI